MFIGKGNKERPDDLFKITLLIGYEGLIITVKNHHCIPGKMVC